MIFRLVFENLKHRPVRTALSMLLIGAQVTMILALVGVSNGVLAGMADRARGTGAQILVRAPEAAATSFSVAMREEVVNVVRGAPHVSLATGVYVWGVSFAESIAGIHLEEFKKMANGLDILEGQPFSKPDDLVIDQVFAEDHKHLKLGDSFKLGPVWHIAGIMEGGKGFRALADIDALRDRASEPNKISVVQVKVDDRQNIGTVVEELKQRLPGYTIQNIDQFTSAYSPDNVPYLKPFIRVVIGIATIVGFLVTLLSMYMAVQERTREIGILKAMGASPGYIVGMLLRETFVLSMAGIVLGIVMSFGTKALLAKYAPSFPQAIVPEWFPWVTLIALGGSLIGALYPGWKAARQDAIEALAYD